MSLYVMQQHKVEISHSSKKPGILNTERLESRRVNSGQIIHIKISIKGNTWVFTCSVKNMHSFKRYWGQFTMFAAYNGQKI